MGRFGRGMKEGRGRQEEKKNSQRRVKGIRSHFNANMLQQMQTRISVGDGYGGLIAAILPRRGRSRKPKILSSRGFDLSGRQGVTSPVTGL